MRKLHFSRHSSTLSSAWSRLATNDIKLSERRSYCWFLCFNVGLILFLNPMAFREISIKNAISFIRFLISQILAFTISLIFLITKNGLNSF